MAQIKSKTVTVGGKTHTVQVGSKADAKYSSQPGAVSSSNPSDIRAAKDASKAATSARSAADPLTVAANAGYDIPDKIAADEMAGVVAGLPKASPEALQASPYTVQEGDTLSGIAAKQGADMSQITGFKSGDPNKIFPGEQLTIGGRIKSAVQGLGGTQAPQEAGTGISGIKGGMPVQEPQETSVWGSLLETDQNLDSVLTDYDKFFSPPEQKKSLVQEYTALTKSLGIQEINEELVNTKRIIEGTEDDIRSEVTAAGGMATESQVLAMASSRNKVLIKNYNALLDTRDNAMTQLNTMMQLTMADRQAAEAEFDRKMNFTFKVAEFRQRAQDNARQTYMTLGSQMGFDVLLNSVSPYEQGVIGKTLGLDAAGLQNLALRSQQDRVMQIQEQNLKIRSLESGLATDAAQRANIYSQIDDRKASSSSNIYGTIDNKPQNVSQSAANSYANRLNESDVIIGTLGNKFTGRASMLPNLDMFKSGDRQAYEQAQNNFVTAVLRRESGASISPSEFETARKTYFPQPGDKPNVIAQKEASRNTVINNFYREANVNRPVLPGQVIESDGKRYKVGIDGESLTLIK